MTAAEQKKALAEHVISTVSDSPRVDGFRGLPAAIDDAERDFGLNIYDRMLNEPYIAAAVNLLVFSVLFDPPTFTPAVKMPPGLGPDASPEQRARAAKLFKDSDEAQKAARALEVCAFAKASLTGIGQGGPLSLRLTLVDLMRAITHGHRLAEITEERVSDGPLAGKRRLKSLRAIPYDYYRFVVDPFNEVQGVLTLQPGKGSPLVTGLMVSPETYSNYVPNEKLLILSHNPVNGNPNGRSVLRPAYAPWKDKQMLRVQELKRILQFGGENLAIMTTPDGAQIRTYPMPDGTEKECTLAYATLQWAREHKSGGVSVFPHGTEIQTIGATSGADLFESKERRINGEMVMAILTSQRTIMESSRSSQADAGKAENLLDTVRAYYSDWLTEAITDQVLVPHLVRNFGPEAKALCPMFSLTRANRSDFLAHCQAIATLINAGAITKPMLPTVLQEIIGIEYIEGEPESQTADRVRQAWTRVNPEQDDDES